jgi:signal transduction histidine kinase
MHQIALGYLELARSKHPEIRHQEYLDKPIEALQRSSRLIQNVRKLQKLKENSPAPGAVDVIRVLRDVQREYGESSGKKIALYLNGYDSCHVLGDELLHDVFANLVSNAVRHTGDGTEIGITLETKAENEGGFCRVSVEDNGPGIPDDAKGWIFGRSMKGTSMAKGMGLGLYLVRSLVDSYGGQVSVEDRVPGDYTQGARFVVTLPVAGQK